MFEKLPDGSDVCSECKLPIVENVPLSGSSFSEEANNVQTGAGLNRVLREPNAQPSAVVATERTQNSVHNTLAVASLPSLQPGRNAAATAAGGDPSANPNQPANGAETRLKEPNKITAEGPNERTAAQIGVREPAVTGNTHGGNSVRVSRLAEGSADSAAEAGGSNEESASKMLVSSAGRLDQLPSTEERAGTAGCDAAAERMEEGGDGEGARGEEGRRHRGSGDGGIVREERGGEGERPGGVGAASVRRQADVQASPTTGKSLGEWWVAGEELKLGFRV